MGRNVLEGFLTEQCEKCEFWQDGSNDTLGCGYPGPIDNCDAFKKMFEANEKEENHQ